MDRDWNKYRPYLLDYVNMITKPSRDKDMYVCPLCGSGTHANATGAFHLKDNNTKWKCYSCEEPRNEKGQSVYGDIYDLYRLKNNCDLNEAYDNIALLFTGEKPRSVPTKKESNKQYESIIDFEKWHEALLHNREALEYLKARRITQETINRHKLGLKNELINEEWKNCIIIPMNEKGYIRRAINDKKFKRYNKNVVMSIIDCVTHEKEPIFIVEGWANAFTLEQMGYNAISLNGSGDNNITMALDYAKGKDNAFICMIDDDKKEENETLYQELKDQGNKAMKFDYDMIDRHFYGEKKDVNDYYASEDKLERTHINRIIKEADEKAKDLILEPQNDKKGTNTLEKEKDAHTANMSVKEQGTSNNNITINLAKYKRLNYSTNIFDNEAIYEPISTGFNELDKRLGGGLYSGITILGAPSSLGKTTFAMNIAENIASSKKHVLYFSLEMTERQMYSKALARKTAQMFYSNYPLNAPSASKISRLRLTKEQLNQVEQARIELDETSGEYMTVIPGKEPLNVNNIIEYIEDYKEIYNVTPVVFIDYLQIIEATSLYQKDIEKLNEIVSKLKRLQLNNQELILFIVSSFNRKNYDKDIEMEAFKGSGNIEYTADVVLGLKLEKGTEIEEHKPRSIELYALKNRHGNKEFQTNFTYFSNCDYFERRALNPTNTNKSNIYSGKWSQENLR